MPANYYHCQQFHFAIDDYVDQDLTAEQVSHFEAHLAECHTCQQELDMAYTLQQEMSALPFQDCPDTVVQTLYEHLEIDQSSAELNRSLGLDRSPSAKANRWSVFSNFSALTLAQLLRPAVPAFALLIIVGMVWVINPLSVLGPNETPSGTLDIAAGDALPIHAPLQSEFLPAMASADSGSGSQLGADYTAEDITQAIAELNLAISYLNEVSERTETMIGQRFLIAPLQDSLNASFEPLRRERGRTRDYVPLLNQSEDINGSQNSPLANDPI